nr:nucleotide-binding alpha-beta plait domain-containing protein [Tanacetum cinerariifolium]
MGDGDWQQVARKKFSHRTKEDDVSKISTSIFVTNFLESFSAKDLFHACSMYGHVIDSFIPLKRSIEGKRFGFVKFINVSNVKRLVGNLCTIWIGRCKLQANIARFDRTPRNDSNTRAPRKSAKKFDGVNVVENNGGTVGNGITFANVLSRKLTPIPDNSANGPVIVLDDDCVNSQDLSFSMMGKVKEFASLTNIKSALCNEGFTDLKIRYLGEFWVWLEFNSLKAKDLFCENIGARSWFSDIIPASEDFIPDGRIAWMDVEGVPFKFWTTKTFSKIATKWGKFLEVDDLEENLNRLSKHPPAQNMNSHTVKMNWRKLFLSITDSEHWHQSLKPGKHRNTLSQMEFMRRKIKRGKEEFAPCARQITKECKAMLRNKIEQINLFNSTLSSRKFRKYTCFYCTR